MAVSKNVRNTCTNINGLQNFVGCKEVKLLKLGSILQWMSLSVYICTAPELISEIMLKMEKEFSYIY